MSTGIRNCQEDVKTSSSFEVWGGAGTILTLFYCCCWRVTGASCKARPQEIEKAQNSSRTWNAIMRGVLLPPKPTPSKPVGRRSCGRERSESSLGRGLSWNAGLEDLTEA